MPLFVETTPDIEVSLTEGKDGKPSVMTSRQAVLHTGKWAHPKAPGGSLNITEARLDDILKNFNAGVGLAGREMPAHIGHTEHVDDRSVAWAHKLEKVADPGRPGQFKLVALSRHTDPAAFAQIQRKDYRYVSPTLVFGYKDRNTGKTHDTVMRNYAYTNYPFLQGMGEVEVLNLSEVALAESRAPGQLYLADGTVDATGGGTAAPPNPEGLPPGYDISSLPQQCTTCSRLGNDCPFAAPKADVDLALKDAAAQSGNCPQYVESSQNQPGGGGAADAQSQSPVNARTPQQGVQMSWNPSENWQPAKYKPDANAMKAVLKHVASGPVREGDLYQSPDSGITGFGSAATHLANTGHIKIAPDSYKGNDSSMYSITPKGLAAHKDPSKLPMDMADLNPVQTKARGVTTKLNDSATAQPDIATMIAKPGTRMHAIREHIIRGLNSGPATTDEIANMPDTTNIQTHAAEIAKHVNYLRDEGHIKSRMIGGKEYHAMTGKGGYSIATTAKLSDRARNTKKESTMANQSHEIIKSRLAEFEAQEQTRFVTALGEKHGLTAAALKVVEGAFKAGTTLSLELADALDAHELALNEGQTPAIPEAFTRLDLSDSVVMSRKSLREAFEAVASTERTEVQLGDTALVDGRPASGSKDLTAALNDMDDPAAAVAALEAAHKAGKC